jgi:hypothetical protein
LASSSNCRQAHREDAATVDQVAYLWEFRTTGCGGSYQQLQLHVAAVSTGVETYLVGVEAAAPGAAVIGAVVGDLQATANRQVSAR